MCDLSLFDEVADDVAVLRAVGEVLEEITGVGGGISAEALAGLGTLMRRTAERVRQAIGEAEQACLKTSPGRRER